MSDDVRIIGFLNPFVARRRLEIVVDWIDSWPDADPFKGAKFYLVVKKGTGAPQEAELTPISIPEVIEQLHVLNIADESNPAQVAKLAPDLVRAVNTMLASPQAQKILAQGAGQTRRLRVDPNVEVFSSANVLSDLQAWYEADERRPEGFFPVRGEIDAFASAVREQSQSPAAVFTADPGKFVSLIDQVSERSPQVVQNLSRAVQSRAILELALYAEALRRDRIYNQRKVEQEPLVPQTSSASDDVAADTLRKQRADVRRVARDEPVIGAMLHVLQWFDWTDDVERILSSAAGGSMRIEPRIDRSTKLPGFESVPTRFDREPNGDKRMVTILSRQRPLSTSYFADAVHVRQVSPALLEKQPSVDDLRKLPTSSTQSLETPDGLKTIITDRVPPELPHLVFGPTSATVMSEADNENPIKVAIRAAITAHDQFQPKEGLLIQASSNQPPLDEELNRDAERALFDAAHSLRIHHAPFDSIGIIWDRALAVDVIRQATKSTESEFHEGFKGYRIDVRENDDPRWRSLCTVEREAVDKKEEHIFRSRLPREGYVFQSVQNNSPEKEKPATLLTMPNDFIRWAGESVAVPSPIDKLGRGLPPPAKDDELPLLALRERGTTRTVPRFGRSYSFRVRGVGLSGVGPTADESRDTPPSAHLDFLRGTQMHAPECDVAYEDLEVRTPDGKLTKSDADVPRLAVGSSPGMKIDAALPIAHWRVALQSRGISDEERALYGGIEFENAVARFVARSRDNWSRLGGTVDRDEEKNGAHLMAVDPGCAGLELVTKVWLPFSSTGPDRHVITGVHRFPFERLGGSTFSELVVQGERIVEYRARDTHMHISVVTDHAPRHDETSHSARLLAGFHTVAEVSGYWLDDELKRSYYRGREDDGRGRWSRHVFMQVDKQRRIGGDVQMLRQPIVLGKDAALEVPWFRVHGCYAGLANLERERDLLPPNQPEAATATGKECVAKPATAIRANVITWRKQYFDTLCEGTHPADCGALQNLYRSFVEAQLAPCERDHTDPANLTVMLQPTIVLDEPHSFVLPVFTFPGEVVAGEVTRNTARAQAVPMKLGKFGTVGVTRIIVEEGGKGYDASNPPLVEITGGRAGSGKDATAKVVMDGDSIASVVLDGAGAEYNDEAKIKINFKSTKTPTKQAVARAKIGPTGRRLPWVDDEITWATRISWRVPLDGGPVERPLELAAVREFRLYRHDRKAPQTDERERPLAILTRPGRELLETVDLDAVEFTWVDAISDRDLHDFEYRIEAIPEDPHTFEKQIWMRFDVTVPDSRIATHPDPMRFIPMLADQSVSPITRRLGLFFSDEEQRTRIDHVTYFIDAAAQDPMLRQDVPVSTLRAREPFTPSRPEDVFPTTCKVTVADTFDDLRSKRPRPAPSDPVRTWDGFEAHLNGAKDPHGRDAIFMVRSREGDADLIEPTGEGFGHPFFRLNVHTFDDKRFPALTHTAASERAESEFLQFYPDDLHAQWDSGAQTLKVLDPWGTASHIWYRYHFFAAATETMSFHLSTFYSPNPALTIDAACKQALAKSWERFTGRPPKNEIQVIANVEEGLRAKTYRIENDVPKEEKDRALFTTLRSTQHAIEVALRLTT